MQHGTSDAFTYFSTPYSGNTTAIVYIDRFYMVNSRSKGGLMIRDTEESASAHVSLLITRALGVTIMSRKHAGGNSKKRSLGLWEESLWLKIVKNGNSFA